MFEKIKFLNYKSLLVSVLVFIIEPAATQSFPFLSQQQKEEIQVLSKNTITSYVELLDLLANKNTISSERNLFINDLLSNYFVDWDVIVLNDLDTSIFAQKNFTIKQYLETINSWYPNGVSFICDSVIPEEIYVSDDGKYVYENIIFKKTIRGTNNRGILIQASTWQNTFVRFSLNGMNTYDKQGKISDINSISDFRIMSGLIELKKIKVKSKEPVYLEKIIPKKSTFPLIPFLSSRDSIISLGDRIARIPIQTNDRRNNNLLFLDIMSEGNNNFENKNFRTARIYFVLADTLIPKQEQVLTLISKCNKKIKRIESPYTTFLRIGGGGNYLLGIENLGRSSDLPYTNYVNGQLTGTLGQRINIRYNKSDSSKTYGTALCLFFNYGGFNDLSTEKLNILSGSISDTTYYKMGNQFYSAELGFLLGEVVRISLGYKNIKVTELNYNINNQKYISISTGICPKLGRVFFLEINYNLNLAIQAKFGIYQTLSVGMGFNFNFPPNNN